MVSTSDILLLGGGVLAAIYLSKRSDQITTIAPTDYYQQVQEVNIQRLSEFGSRIEQLKDIRSQILGFEKQKAQEEIAFLQTQIGEAQQAGSAAQRRLTVQDLPVSQSIYKVLVSTKDNFGQAINYFLNQGELLKAQILVGAAERQQASETLRQSQEFISQAEQQQADIMAKYSELEQIV